MRFFLCRADLEESHGSVCPESSECVALLFVEREDALSIGVLVVDVEFGIAGWPVILGGRWALACVEIVDEVWDYRFVVEDARHGGSAAHK